jgi:N-acetylmuramoyl-L-alanine amidase
MSPGPVQWVGCAPRNFRRGRAGYRPEAIVIHIIDASLKSADNSFLNPTHGKSAHYGVGRSGEIHQYVAETDTAYHAGTVVEPKWKSIRPARDAPHHLNPNLYTVGIEHEGKATDVWTEAQYAASARLIVEIASRWRIPLDEDHVIPHRDIRSNKTCPGREVDLKRLLEAARALRTPVPSPVPAGNAPAGATATPIAGSSPAPPAVNAPVTTTLPARVVVTKPVRMRTGRPSRLAPSAGVLRPPFEFAPLGLEEHADEVEGNSRWYRIDTEMWVWSGGTDQPGKRQGA